jgi:uncharacterized protein
LSTAAEPGADSAAAVGQEQDPFLVFDPQRVEPDLRVMTRIVLRPIASPMPLGFFTVAIDSAIVSTCSGGSCPAV